MRAPEDTISNYFSSWQICCTRHYVKVHRSLYCRANFKKKIILSVYPDRVPSARCGLQQDNSGWANCSDTSDMVEIIYNRLHYCKTFTASVHFHNNHIIGIVNMHT